VSESTFTWRTAREPYKCDLCMEIIRKGERYLNEFYYENNERIVEHLHRKCSIQSGYPQPEEKQCLKC
jgi:hypothetical protein